MTEIDARLDALRDESAESVVRTYLERWDAHDVEGMIALLNDGQVMTWEECGWGFYREFLLRGLAWHLGADFSITSFGLEVKDADTVHVTLEWTTRVDELLSVHPPPRSYTFRVHGGIIEEILCRPFTGAWSQYEGRRREALTPVHAWTAEHRPEEVEELFIGKGVLNAWGTTIRGRRRRARRQIVLLEDYRNATELADLTKDQLHSFKWRLDPDGHSTGTISLFYPHPETGETVWDNRRLGWRSLGELPRVLAAIIREYGDEKGEWRH